jgi:hypothetical protein
MPDEDYHNLKGKSVTHSESGNTLLHGSNFCQFWGALGCYQFTRRFTETMLTRTKTDLQYIQQTETNKQRLIKRFYQGIEPWSFDLQLCHQETKDWRTKPDSPMRGTEYTLITHTLTAKYCRTDGTT